MGRPDVFRQNMPIDQLRPLPVRRIPGSQEALNLTVLFRVAITEAPVMLALGVRRFVKLAIFLIG